MRRKPKQNLIDVFKEWTFDVAPEDIFSLKVQGLDLSIEEKENGWANVVAEIAATVFQEIIENVSIRATLNGAFADLSYLTEPYVENDFPFSSWDDIFLLDEEGGEYFTKEGYEEFATKLEHLAKKCRDMARAIEPQTKKA